MVNKLMDPIGRLMGLRYKSHPWHGVDIGPEAPEVIISFIEMVSTDTVKYEVDKVSGYLRLDRPQKYSNVIPALYGFIPKTFSGQRVADFCMKMTGKKNIPGKERDVEITHTFGVKDAHEIIRLSMDDYSERFERLETALSNV